MASTCCEAPDPRILEKNGRTFCANCRRYLDARPASEEEPPEAPAITVEPEKENA